MSIDTGSLPATAKANDSEPVDVGQLSESKGAGQTGASAHEVKDFSIGDELLSRFPQLGQLEESDDRGKVRLFEDILQQLQHQLNESRS